MEYKIWIPNQGQMCQQDMTTVDKPHSSRNSRPDRENILQKSHNPEKFQVDRLVEYQVLSLNLVGSSIQVGRLSVVGRLILQDSNNPLRTDQSDEFCLGPNSKDPLDRRNTGPKTLILQDIRTCQQGRAMVKQILLGNSNRRGILLVGPIPLGNSNQQDMLPGIQTLQGNNNQQSRLLARKFHQHSNTLQIGRAHV